MASESLPAAHSPTAKGDDKVLSQRTFPGQGEVQEAIMVAPGGKTLTSGHMGEQIPMATGGLDQFGPQPNTILETHAAPESGEQPPSKEGCVPILPVTSVQPEALDSMLEAL